MKEMSLQTKQVQVGKYTLFTRYSVENKKTKSPPIILIHGFAVSGNYMIPLAKQLSSFATVYAPDFPGYGKSSHPPDVLSLTEMADTLTKWMEEMEISKAVLLGNSLGCQIIVDFALRYPDKLTHAILVGPTIDVHERSFFKQTLRLFHDMFYEPLSYYPIALKDSITIGIRRIIKTGKYALHDPLRLQLPRVKVPVLVVRGGRDPLVPQLWAEEVVSLLPQAELVIVPGAGHVVNFNSPDILSQEVKRFLQKH